MKSSNRIGQLVYWVAAGALVAFFIITSRPFTYSETVERGFSDVMDYVAVATSPNLEALYSLSLNYPMHRLERWLSHFLIGQISQFFTFDLWQLYRLAVLCCLFGLICIINQLHAKPWQKITILLLLVFNPYTFRQYYAAAGMVVDCLFYISIAGMAVAMVNRHWYGLILSICIAIFLRQTGLLLLPILVLYGLSEKQPIPKIVIGLVLGVLSFGLIKMLRYVVFAPVESGYVAMHMLGFFSWLRTNPNWADAVDFLGRYGLMWLTLSPLLILVRSLDNKDWMWVFYFAILQIQPLLGGPSITSSNIDRLAIYGLPFMAMLMVKSDASSKWYLLFAGLVIALSFLPNFSILDGMSYGRIFYVGMVVTIAMISVWYHRRRFTGFTVHS